MKLEDVRIDSVDDGPTRLLLQSGLVPALPNAIELDVLKAVRTMLQGSSQFQVTVDSFNIESAAVVDSHLSVKFNFKLVAR